MPESSSGRPPQTHEHLQRLRAAVIHTKARVAGSLDEPRAADVREELEIWIEGLPNVDAGKTSASFVHIDGAHQSLQAIAEAAATAIRSAGRKRLGPLCRRCVDFEGHSGFRAIQERRNACRSE